MVEMLRELSSEYLTLCSCTHHRVHCHCLSNSLPDLTQGQPGFSLSQFITVVQDVVHQDDNLIPK